LISRPQGDPHLQQNVMTEKWKKSAFVLFDIDKARHRMLLLRHEHEKQRLKTD